MHYKIVKRCHGFGSRWWWPCGASPTVEKGGLWWCRNHVPLTDREMVVALAKLRDWVDYYEVKPGQPCLICRTMHEKGPCFYDGWRE